MNINIQDLPNEIWKDIQGYENLYKISNLGRILSLKIISSYNLPRIIKTFINSTGYSNVQLKNNKKYKNFLLHRLLAIAFIPNPFNLDFINHKDGNKLNNILENLEWCTRKYNSQHAVKIGLMTNKHRIGGKLPENLRKKMTKINKDIANNIRHDYSTGLYTYRNLEKKYNISDSQVGAIIKNKYWI